MELLELASPALWILLGSANERQEQVFGGQEKGKSRVLLPQLIFPPPLLPVSLHAPEVAVSISSCISVEQILLQSSHWKTGSGQHSGPCLSLQAWGGNGCPTAAIPRVPQHSLLIPLTLPRPSYLSYFIN